MANELLVTPDQVTAAWPKFAGYGVDEQTALIADASQAILDFCRRDQFLQAFVTEALKGKNRPSLWLSRKPVISVASVTVNGTALDNSTNEAWTFEPDTGRLWRGSGLDDPRFATWFGAGIGNVVVAYWAGYTAIPDPVIRAAKLMVQYLAGQSKVSGVYSQESFGDYSYTLNPKGLVMTLPPSVAALCAAYVQEDGPY